jgi:hypothetical protein
MASLSRARTHVLANLVWPALFLLERLLALHVIVIGLAIEYLFIRRFTGLDSRRALCADLAVNLVSTVVGLILIPAVGFGLVLVVSGTFSPLAWAVTYLSAVGVNTLVEGLVLAGMLRRLGSARSSGYGWLLAANSLSVGTALPSLAVWPVSP